MTSSRAPGLRIAVLANFDSPHGWRWVKEFVHWGHEVHGISYYKPHRELPGVTVHVLRPGNDAPAPGPAAASQRRLPLPDSAFRLVNALRFRRAGLSSILRDISPDLFHAHFVVEHGFFGAMAGFHPYVLSAWGSDLFRAPRTPLGSAVARYALGRADLLTANDPALYRAALRLGLPPDRGAVIRLGLDADWFAQPLTGVNVGPDTSPPTVLSDRALEPLYNVDTLVRAFALLRRRLPSARLIVAGDGSQRPRLERLAEDLGQAKSIEFAGVVLQERLRVLLQGAHVYTSVPSSDSLAVSTMEAMAAGTFPVVSNLESQDGWITHRLTGLRVPPRDVDALAENLHVALTDAGLRREAAVANRARVEAEGRLDRNMKLMERHYYRLTGHPISEQTI
jgi:glycosyltransferase involved in cell wall biosynthesis